VTAPLVRFENFSLTLRGGGGELPVLRGIDLEIARGRIVGIVGESGSGKTSLALALMRLLPPNVAAVRGRILFDDVDLLTLDDAAMRRLRGRRMAMVFQDPMSALNPVHTVDSHMREVQAGQGLSRHVMRDRAVTMMRRVGIPDPQARLFAYPHHLSGGMRQRVMIAMALLMEPDILIGDEPTTALDATIEAQIVELMKDLRTAYHGSILLISHSLGLVAELCDDVAVMYAGKLVETGPTVQVLQAPRHPYTAALLACERAVGGFPLPSIAGELPDLADLPSGCVFAPRCARRVAECLQSDPPLLPLGGVRRFACYRPVS